MKYIEAILEINAKPIDLDGLSEHLQEYYDIESIIIEGVVGSEVDSADILELSYTNYILRLIMNNGLDIDHTSLDGIKNIITLFGVRVKKIAVKTDDTDYTLVTSKFTLQVGTFTITNETEVFEKLEPSKRIFIEESTGFGTGRHNTTSMCIEALEELQSEVSQSSDMLDLGLLDLGTGSGILAITMAKLFKANILATDLDELALNSAREFIEKNNVANLVSTLYSVGFTSIKPHKYNIITANILLNPLIEMRNDFYDYLAHDGYLILSGFLVKQIPELEQAFREKFVVVKTNIKDDWGCLILKKKI